MKISYIKPDIEVLEFCLGPIMDGVDVSGYEDPKYPSTDAPALNTEIEDDTNSI